MPEGNDRFICFGRYFHDPDVRLQLIHVESLRSGWSTVTAYFSEQLDSDGELLRCFTIDITSEHSGSGGTAIIDDYPDLEEVYDVLGGVPYFKREDSSRHGALQVIDVKNEDDVSPFLWMRRQRRTPASKVLKGGAVLWIGQDPRKSDLKQMMNYDWNGDVPDFVE